MSHDRSQDNQGRGPSPTTWRIVDAIVCSIGAGLLFWVIQLCMEKS